jgi:hypothetical protein
VRKLCFAALLSLLGLGLTTSVLAQEEPPPSPPEEAAPPPQEGPPPLPPEEAAPPPQEGPPPLPLHGIEGMGGVFSTYSAYLVNSVPAETTTFSGCRVPASLTCTWAMEGTCWRRRLPRHSGAGSSSATA